MIQAQPHAPHVPHVPSPTRASHVGVEAGQVQQRVCGLVAQDQRQHGGAHHARSGLSVTHEGLGGGEVQGRGAGQARAEQHRRGGPHLDGVAQGGACQERTWWRERQGAASTRGILRLHRHWHASWTRILHKV